MEIIAHRGASFDHPENSLAAFREAIVQGADRIELDVHVTVDGVAVIHHDENTARLAGQTLEIAWTTAATLRDLRLPNGEPVPTLEEACALVRGRIPLDVELKSVCDRTAQVALGVLRDFGLEESTLLTSFNPQVLRRAHQLGFRGRIGLLIGSKSLNPRQRALEAWPFPAMEEAAASELVLHHLLAHRPLRAALRRKGHGLWLWSAMDDERRTPEERAALYRKMAAADPAGIIVGRITESRAVLAAAGVASNATNPAAQDV